MTNLMQPTEVLELIRKHEGRGPVLDTEIAPGRRLVLYYNDEDEYFWTAVEAATNSLINVESASMEIIAEMVSFCYWRFGLQSVKPPETA